MGEDVSGNSMRKARKWEDQGGHFCDYLDTPPFHLYLQQLRVFLKFKNSLHFSFPAIKFRRFNQEEKLGDEFVNSTPEIITCGKTLSSSN